MSYGESTDVKPTHLIRKQKVFDALHWLKINNDVYQDVVLDFDEKYCTEMLTEENLLDSNIDEYSAIPIDYAPPNVDVADLINCKTPHIKLPKCKGPLSAYELVNGEEFAFPYLFPFGINGFKAERNKDIDTSLYFRHRLKYFDGRFRKDNTYLLHAINHYEFLRLTNSVSILMRMRKSANDNSCITVNDLNNVNHNPDILQNSYMFMKFIKGTAAYWKNTLHNLLAMFKQLGPPSLFVTLSANDMHWPELIMTLKKCTYEEAKVVGNALNFVKEDPYMTALHFQRRFKALLKHVINGEMLPLGKVVDYFVRVEFQNRGSPHFHIFFWIENFNAIFSDQEKLTQYIDKTISTKTSYNNFV